MSRITRRGLIGSTAAGAGALAVPTSTAAAPRGARTPGAGRRERLLMDFGWRFAFGHASDIARDFGFGLNQRTFAKQGVNVAAAAALAPAETSVVTYEPAPDDVTAYRVWRAGAAETYARLAAPIGLVGGAGSPWPAH